MFNDPPVAHAPRVTTSHSSVDATAVGVGFVPPNAKAAVFVPVPAKPDLIVFKSFTSVQLVPFQISVAPVNVEAGGLAEFPPNAKAAV